MSATTPSFENWTYSEEIIAFSARILNAGESNEGAAYIAYARMNDDVVSTSIPDGASDLRFVQFSDSAETAGDLDDITGNAGANPRYMPTGNY